jgi:hypothetical protein
MNKLNTILVVLLVLQLIVAAIVILPGTAAPGEAEAGALLPEVEAEHIAGLTITDADGRTVHLAKVEGNWVLADADAYPTQADVVPEFLNKIVALKASRLVTETPGSHKRLKVAADDFERQIDVAMDDGSQTRFYLGSSPSYAATHVRVDGEDEVYLTSELSAQDARPEATAWVDRVYFSVPQEQVVALTLENAQGRLEFVKEGEAWTLADLAEGETLNQSALTTLLSRATSVSMQRPLGKEEKGEYGLAEPSAVVILETQSEEGEAKTYTLRVGAQDPADNSYVFVSSESPYYVRVAQFSAQDFVEKVRDDFLVQPTPTPEATPAG